MNQRAASHHRWVKNINSDILSDFGTNGAKKLRKTLNDENIAKITVTYELLDKSHLDWFTPLYNSHISSLHNPNPRDVYESTLGKTDAQYPYYIMTISEDNEIIGAMIYTLREDRVSIVYRAIAHSWSKFDMLASPPLLAEYLITTYAIENGKNQIVHGSDKNFYGVNTNIGMAIFKLSIGCHPYVREEHEIISFNESSISTDTLVFLYPTDGDRITNAILYTRKDTESKYTQLLSYRDRLEIEVKYIEN